MKTFFLFLSLLTGYETLEIKTMAQSANSIENSKKIISIDLNLTEIGYEKNKEVLDSLSMKYPEVQLHIDTTQSITRYLLHYPQTIEKKYEFLNNDIMLIVITINIQETEMRLPPKKSIKENNTFKIVPHTSYKDSIDVQGDDFNSPVSEVYEITEQTHYILTLDIKEDLTGSIGRGYLKEFSNKNSETSLATYIINEKPVLILIMNNTLSAEVMRDALRDYLRKKGSSIFEIESYEIINDKFYRHIGWNYRFPNKLGDSLKMAPSSASAKSVTFTKNPTTQDLQKNNTDTQDDISVNFNVQYWAITVGASYTDKEEALHDLKSFNALSPQMSNAKFKVVALENGVFSIVYDSNQYLSKNEAKLETKDIKNLVGNAYFQLSKNFLKKNHTNLDSDEDCACNLSLNTALITRQEK